MPNRDFYKAFEDRYRGSRENIKNRLQVYLPFVLPIKKLYPDAVALDIGCGRGEWLELLSENKIKAKGIDFDEGMLKACQTLNLNVMQGDGIKYLKEQESESISIISAFHVVEHISFEELQTFIKESLRVLKPGGLLILETPNPENIRVSTESFYLDPTHSRPIPSSLLAFIPEFYGFARTKVLKLQEKKSLLEKEHISVLDVLDGVSPDYAVIAQKNAKEDILQILNNQFSRNYGLSLGDLTAKFENRIYTIEQKLIETRQLLSAVNQRSIELENKYNLLINSRSWKITKPLRVFNSQMKTLKANIKPFLSSISIKNIKSALKPYLISLKHYIVSKPKVKQIALLALKPFPKLKNRLKNMGKYPPLTEDFKELYPSSIKQLSPKAQQVYKELKEAIDSQKGDNL